MYKYIDKPRSKTPTPFGSVSVADTLPLRSRTPLPTTNIPMSNTMQNPVPLAKTEFSPDSVYTFDRQATLTRSVRDTRPTNAPLIRSKTPGPEFGGTTSSSSSSKYANTMKPRSKTPTDYEFSSNTLQNRFANITVMKLFSLYIFLLVDHYNLFINNIWN
jgi:hypothetical protein